MAARDQPSGIEPTVGLAVIGQPVDVPVADEGRIGCIAGRAAASRAAQRDLGSDQTVQKASHCPKRAGCLEGSTQHFNGVIKAPAVRCEVMQEAA
jgi:hypothetical protein